MKPYRLLSCLLLLCAPFASFGQSAPLPTSAVRYRVTDIGALPGAGEVTPYDLNDSGEIVGGSQVGGVQPAGFGFHWTEAQGMKDIGTLGGVSTYASGINNRGQFVGQSSGHPFISLKEGGIKALEDVSGTAFAINDLGQVTGHAVSLEATDHAFLWSAAKGLQDLGVLPGYSKSWGMGINALGNVAGFLEADGGSPRHAFFWQQNTLKDLGTLGGKNSEAHSLNDGGQVVGTSYVAGKIFHGFLWQKGRMEDLGAQNLTLLPGAGAPNSEAESINNRGQIVGTATDDHGTNIACLWEKGHIYDLNTLIPADAGWHLVYAAHINVLGQIVGYGSRQSDENNHGFLLTPLVPQDSAPAESPPPAPTPALPTAPSAKAFKVKKPAALPKRANFPAREPPVLLHLAWAPAESQAKRLGPAS